MALVAQFQVHEKGCLNAYEIALIAKDGDGASGVQLMFGSAHCLLVLVTPEGELLSLPPHLPAGVKTPIRVMPLLLTHTLNPGYIWSAGTVFIPSILFQYFDFDSLSIFIFLQFFEMYDFYRGMKTHCAVSRRHVFSVSSCPLVPCNSISP